jgi:hypothetical protein
MKAQRAILIPHFRFGPGVRCLVESGCVRLTYKIAFEVVTVFCSTSAYSLWVFGVNVMAVVEG